MRIDHPSHGPAFHPSKPRVAVVGSGIGGLAAAWHLRGLAQVTLLEAGNHLGGHANTVDITLGGKTFGVDTGFLVCNHRTYPGLMPLFAELGVALAPSNMGFSVQVRQANGHSLREWAGTGIAGLFAQLSNAATPRFWGMLRDILRFNRLATHLAQQGADEQMAESTGEFLRRHALSDAFRDDYLIPMVACIWSCSPTQMMDFPVGTLIRFCHNHGLLQVINQPQWYTVTGGSREYVKRIAQHVPDVRLNCPVLAIDRDAHGATLTHAHGRERFDAVVVACHSDQSRRLLGTQATEVETSVLGAIAYQPNRAVLHTDTRLMPERAAAWAAWNYETANTTAGAAPNVCLHYWLNALQPLPVQQPVIVSLNPLREPLAHTVIAEFDYEHPIFNQAAIDAQRRLPVLRAQSPALRTWLAGAWMGYGFHEDGYQAGCRAAEGVIAALGLGHTPVADATTDEPAESPHV